MIEGWFLRVPIWNAWVTERKGPSNDGGESKELRGVLLASIHPRRNDRGSGGTANTFTKDQSLEGHIHKRSSCFVYFLSGAGPRRGRDGEMINDVVYKACLSGCPCLKVACITLVYIANL